MKLVSLPLPLQWQLKLMAPIVNVKVASNLSCRVATQRNHGIVYHSSHNHGSVKNGCISNRIVTFQMSSHFSLNHDFKGERAECQPTKKGSYNLDCIRLEWAHPTISHMIWGWLQPPAKKIPVDRCSFESSQG